MTRARGASRVHGLTAGRSFGGIAQRSLRHQAARVDGIKRDVGADRGVDRGPELRLVVQTVALDAAGEIDQRFFLVERSQHFDGGFERGQLAVRVEDVELGVVLLEGGAGIGGAVVLVVDFESLAFADDQAF